ncbi:protein-S-isoprenylcysteine O-methyltransferase [Asimina triloba]
MEGVPAPGQMPPLPFQVDGNGSVRADGIEALPPAEMAELLGYTACRQLGQLFAAVAFFHTSEYALAIAIHGRFRVSLTSLLISKQYLLAMAFALLEYLLEVLLVPGLKEYWWISNFGLVMVVVGEVIRKTAILTARGAFTHTIRTDYEEEHELVTSGIYRFIRHPGYCGFFIWAPATQIMLCNPVSAVGFLLTFALRKTFSSTRNMQEGSNPPYLIDCINKVKKTAKKEKEERGVERM